MLEKDLSDVTVAIIILVISCSDFYKGILMTFTNQTPLLFIAQIAFLIIRLLPGSIRERQYQDAMNAYVKRRRLNGIYAIVGGFLGMLVGVFIFLNA
jgi:hypothetical protein